VLSHFLSASLLPVYDTSGAASDRNSVVLNDIHIDIMDYIVPASCTDTEFRQMWAEFEWENKVAVNTNISDLHEYLDHIIQCTNMKCLTPEKVKLLLVVFSVSSLFFFFIFMDRKMLILCHIPCLNVCLALDFLGSDLCCS